MTAADSDALALLEIDLQPWILDIAHDRGMAPAARRVRAAMRERGATVLCTRYLSLDLADPLRSDPEGEGARFLDGLGPGPGDIVLTKHGRDVFDNPDVLANLRAREIDHVVFDGLLTDHGVLLAARSALDAGLRVTIAAAACAGSDEGAHRSALAALAAAGAVVDTALGARRA